MPGRAFVEMLRAVRAEQREHLDSTVHRHRSGRVESVDPETRVVMVTLDPDTNASPVRVTGGNPPSVGDWVGVIVDPNGTMELQLGVHGLPPSTVASLLAKPTPNLNTAYINECWLWGHSYVGADTGRTGGYGWASTVGHPHGLDDYLFGGLGLAWPMTRTVGQSAAQLYAFVGQHMMNTGYTDPERITFAHPYNQGVGPYTARRGAHVMVFGTNDVAYQGDPAMEAGRALTQWKHSVRSACAWLRLGAYFAPYLLYSAGAAEGGTATASKYAGCTYGAGWTRTPAAGVAPTQGNGGLDLGNNTFYPGSGYMKTTTSNATFTIRVPADHPGTTVWLFFVGEIGQTGAPSAIISWAGGFLFTTLSTNDIVRSPQVVANEFTGSNLPVHAMCAVPVPLIRTNPQAAQTITVNAGTLGAGHMLRFVGWGIESPDPKQITWGTIPLPKIWHGNTATGPAGMNWPAYPDPSGWTGTNPQPSPAVAQPADRTGAEAGDTWAGLYDVATAAVAAEFMPVGSVCVASLAAFNGLTAKYLFRDRIHPNREGNRVLAEGLLTGMNLAGLTAKNLSSHSVGRELAPFAMGMP